MATDQELLIRINGTAKNFTDALTKAEKKTEDLRKGLATTAKLAAAGFAALTAVVAGTTARFASFEKGFTNVVTLLDKSSFATKTLSKGIDDLKSGVISLGAETGESFETLNQGLFDLISSGTNADEALDSLTVATQLAAAGATDTATAVKALAATTTAFGKEAGTAAEIAEKFFTAQKFGVTTVGELATEFNKVAGISKSLGLGFDEVLASLSSLTADGAKPTAEAATQLKALFNSLILVQGKLGNETLAVRDALSLQNVQERGLIESLNLLKSATGGNIEELQRLVGSSEALGVVLSLTGGQAELVEKQVNAMGNAQERAATFATALAVKNATTEKALARLAVSGDAVATVIGEQFAPAVNAAANFLSKFAQIIVNANPFLLKSVAVIVGLGLGFTALVGTLAVAALGYLKFQSILVATNAATFIAVAANKALSFALIAGDKVLKIFRLTTLVTTTAMRALAGATGIGLILVAISLLIANFDKLIPATKATFAAVTTFVTEAAKNIVKRFTSIGNLLIGVFTLDLNKIKSSLTDLKDAFTTGTIDVAKKAADAFTKTFNEAVALEAPTIPEPTTGTGEDDKANKAAKTEEELQRLREEAEIKRQLIAEEDEKDKALKAALAEVDEETRKNLTEKDLKDFSKTIETKRSTEAKIAKERIANQIKEHNTFLAEQIKFGTAFATINQLINTQEVQGVKGAAGQLVALTQSKNDKLKAIGKAASVVQIAIRTAEGALSAFAALQFVPFIGPALGAAAAAAVIAFGGEQTANVLNAQGGGVVPNTLGGARDRTLINAEPGEVIIPKALAPGFIQSVGRPDFGGGGDQTQTEVVISLKEEAVEMFEVDIVTRQSQGISKLPNLGVA